MSAPSIQVTTPSHRSLEFGAAFISRAPVVLAVYAILGGVISFLGWPLDRPRLTDWFGTDVSMQPNTSVLITVAGIGLLLLQTSTPWRRTIAMMLGVIVAAAGALIASQYIVGDLGINHQLLFGRTWGQSTTTTPGRTGPPASVSFALLGTGLAILARARSRHDPRRRYVPTLGVVVCLLMLLGLFGYVFGARQFFAVPGLTAIAFQTASMILALAVALMAAVPERHPMLLLREKTGTGTMARIVLPTLIILPPLVSWLRTFGMTFGYYDEGTSRALGALTLVVANVSIMWWALLKLKRREEQERASEARLRSLVGVITDVSWVTDADGAFREPHREWEKFTGQSWERQQGLGWLDAIHPDDRDAARVEWQQACASASVYESRGRLWHAPSQSWHHFVSRATPLFNNDGSVREWVGSHTDIHSQVLAEETMRAADRRKDEFLATLAHELRNPLAPIRNAVQILQLKGPQDPELRWAHGVIDRQMEHMSRLIDDLLDVSRISRGRIELKRERVELATILHGAIEASRPLIESRRHHFEVQLPEKPLFLNADLTRLAQVFSNLLNNAAKYTEPGGRIVMHAERQGSDVRVEIRDNGIGIPEDMREQVFELFAQVGSSLDRASGGLGIGLTLVRRLVEMHGGGVDVRSDGLGKGSTFTVRLPVLLDAVVPANLPLTQVLPTAIRRRVLVVDDNNDAADTLAMMLRANGCEVQTAYDGDAAIRTAGDFRPDIVLLDIGLPKTSGYDVARAIRASKWGSSVALIALTGWGQEDDRRRSLEAGFDHHLVKPVAPDRLLTLLSSLATARRPAVAAPGQDAPLQKRF